MPSALQYYRASAMARGLQAGTRTLPQTRTQFFRTPAPELCQIHVFPDSQNRAWSHHGMRARALNLSKTGAGVGQRRLVGQSALDSALQEDIAANEKDKISSRDSPSRSPSRQRDRDRSEGTKQERGERKRSESRARDRDSHAQSSRIGRLLTTPSRSLKLLIPLPTDHPEEMETIAILIHSQQPLSYLERLIQTELSSIEDESGHKRPPGIFFIACQFEDDAISPRISHNGKSVHDIDLSHDMEVKKVEGEDDKGQGRRKKSHPPEEDIHTYTSLGKPQSSGNSEKLYVRWSHATEVGDFIRDAARAGEFIIAIEGAPDGLDQIRIKVPSFNERTYYLRMRLRMISNRISKIASIKYECDKLAHRGGQRVALAGFGVLASWWLLVYKLTFLTSLGWDTMEPVTYLVSLSTLMGGYLWFLYHNREISYRSALEFTINNRQKKLYQEKGVDLQVWENLIHEGNLLRREIRAISSDYDTEWDEKMDEHDERVIEAMKQKRNEGKSKDKDDCLDDDKDKSND